MKTLMRKYARFVSNVTKRFACETFGDTASLHAGPCERCVGHAVEGVYPTVEPPSTGSGGVDLRLNPSAAAPLVETS